MNIGKINEKYCLHDCVINKIEIRDSTLILCLSKGVYQFNANTGIYKISENCNIHMNIDNLNEKEVCEHVSINLFKT